MTGYVRYKRNVYKYVDKDENGYKLEIFNSEPGEAPIIYQWVSVDYCEEVENKDKNPILESVKSLLERQTEKGIQKYGTTVKIEDYSVIGWIEHAQEELMDGLVYLETLKQKLKQLIE